MPELFVPVKKLRHLLDDVLPHPGHVKNVHEVAELIRDLQDSVQLDDLHLLQQKLFKAISEAERQQRESTEALKNLARVKEATVKAGRHRGSVYKDRLREQGQESDKLRLEISVLKRVRRQLRAVGDGLLWKAVGFNRAYVYAVWDAPGRGNTALSEPVGLAAELQVVERLWKAEGTLAVMHDLTNCGRVGDLTMVPSKETENIKIAEVKAGSSVNSKQTKRMEDLVRFTRGGPKVLEHGYTVRASGSLVPSANLLESDSYSVDVYRQAVCDADERGLGWGTIGDYMGLLAIAPLHPRWDPTRTAEISSDEQDNFFREAFEPAYRGLTATLMSRKGDKIFVWDSSETQEDMLLGAPFSLYPFPPETCAALTCDYIKVMVYLNVSSVQRLFEDHGFQVTSLDDPKDDKKLQFFWNMVLSKPKFTKDGWKMVHVHLGKTLWQQIMGEMLSIEAVLKAVREEMKGKVEGRRDTSLLFINGDGRRYKMVPPV